MSPNVDGSDLEFLRDLGTFDNFAAVEAFRQTQRATEFASYFLSACPTVSSFCARAVFRTRHSASHRNQGQRRGFD
jgi:hypothetical protein